MIDGKAENPWDKLSDYDRDRIERLVDSMGMEIYPWQKQYLACFLLDPPGTTYVLQPSRRSGASFLKMARSKLETFE